MKKEFIYFDNAYIKTISIFAVRLEELEKGYIVEVLVGDEIFGEKFDSEKEAKTRQEQVMEAITGKTKKEECNTEKEPKTEKTRFGEIEIEFINLIDLEKEREKINKKAKIKKEFEKILDKVGIKQEKLKNKDNLFKEFLRQVEEKGIDEAKKTLEIALEMNKSIKDFLKNFIK